MNFPPINEQMDILRRGVEEIIPEEELVSKLEKSIKNSQPLEIKLGCDPSRPDLHIGHAVVLRKLRQFQDFGHICTLLIGDFTAMIGDPTGRNKTRPQLTIKDTKNNSQSYIDQAGSVLDLKTLKIVYNSSWLGKMNFNDIITLSSKYTVARILERDDFTKRYKNGQPISLHEFLYPLAQGYDSVILKSDVELGGTDQKFNLLVGRELQKTYNLEPQVIMTTPLLEGTDGVEKMSKSYDNYIGITDSPTDIYGRTLSIPDELITRYFEFATIVSNDELSKIKLDLKGNKTNPRDLKRQLARELVSIYHNKDEAIKAEQEFDNLFINKDIPDNIPDYLSEKGEKLITIMVKNNLVSSNGEARRMISQGAVKIDGKKIDDIHFIISTNKPLVLKVGKRQFIRILF